MKIEPKWKKFAIDHYFSHDPDRARAVLLFDELLVCDTDDEVQVVLDYLNAIPWRPYENMGRISLAVHMESMARTAQDAARADVWVVVEGGCVTSVYADTPLTVGVIDLDDQLDETESATREANIQCAKDLTEVWP